MIDSSPKSVAQSRQEQTPNPAQDEHIQHGITYLRQLLSESAFKDGMIKASTAPIRREEDALHVQLKQKMIDEATHSSSLAQLKASTAQQTLLVAVCGYTFSGKNIPKSHKPLLSNNLGVYEHAQDWRV